MNPAESEPGRFKVALEVHSKEQLEELQAAWTEIIHGKRARTELARVELDKITERAMWGLEQIVDHITAHSHAGSTRRLVQFLAAMYNGYDYDFDLTDLRGLDSDLAAACIDYLNYDRLGKTEVHQHLPGGGEQLQQWIADQGTPPRLHLNSEDQQRRRLMRLVRARDVHPNTLVRDALNDMFRHYESKEFGLLRPQVVWREGGEERSKTHAYRLEGAHEPLCKTTGAWIERPFEFTAITCDDCLDVILDV